MTRNRADIGFEDDLDGFDPSEWAPAPAPARPESAGTQRVAEATGFRSREARPVQDPVTTHVTAPVTARAAAGGAGEGATLPRRRRTGRNAQFNLKARPDTIQSFYAVADAQGWGLGETLEHAVRLLQREYGNRDGS